MTSEQLCVHGSKRGLYLWRFVKVLTNRHMQKEQQYRAKLYGLYNLLVWLLIDVSAKTRYASSAAGSTCVDFENNLKGTHKYPLVGDGDSIRESKMWLK